MTTVTETHPDWAILPTLHDYRIIRVHGRQTPYHAAREVADNAARYLADRVLQEDGDLDYAKARYAATLAVLEAVKARADLRGGRKFHELSATEQYWNTGTRRMVS